MTNILLLGAGFSANWGAPVVTGMFNALIADPEVRASEQMKALLWANRKNFELALSSLQQSFRQYGQPHRAPLLLMQGALGRIFAQMNGLFERRDLELPDDGINPPGKETKVKEFLANYDAIFTLNQDLLLEIHYFDQAHNQFTNRRWVGGCMPGLTPVGVVENNKPWSGRIWNPSAEFDIPQLAQPYFKLHGSSNWKSTGNEADLTIMGGGKPEAIQAVPTLRRYHDIFAEYCNRGGTHLTIIGYGFMDDHINAVLKGAIEDRGLLMFVNDLRGAGLAYDLRPYIQGQVGALPVSEFEVWFQKGLYSASTLPLRQLLKRETLDRETLNAFLTEH